jgi:hypothetical protein
MATLRNLRKLDWEKRIAGAMAEMRVKYESHESSDLSSARITVLGREERGLILLKCGVLAEKYLSFEEKEELVKLVDMSIGACRELKEAIASLQ